MSEYQAENLNEVQKQMTSAYESLLENADPTDAEMLKEGFQALQESMDEVRRSLAWEDKGWSLWWGNQNDNTGLTLEEVKDASEKIRVSLVGMPLMKRASELREIYIWGKGLVVPGVEKAARGADSALRRFYTDTVNRENLFSTQAHLEMERALASDGNFFLLGENSTKRMRRIPVSEITGLYVNPDFGGEVWAYRRSWSATTSSGPVAKDVWYYTDTYSGRKAGTINVDGKNVPVDSKYTIFTLSVNRQIGFPLGAPDLLAALPWARLYSEGMKRGDRVQEAMTRIIYKATSATPAGVNNMAAKIANSSGAGNTLATAQGNALDVMSSAGKGYQFETLQPIAAMVAQAAGVDIVNLLASPGAAGSSYGAASVLTPSTKKTMVTRQAVHIDFLDRIGEWAVGKPLGASFDEIDDIDPYRASQQAQLFWLSGTAHPEEVRTLFLKALKVNTSKTSAPTGVMIPNNEKSLSRKDIDTDGTPTATAATPGQGVANGTGGQNSNDTRTDLVSEMMASSNLDRMQALVERMENAAKGIS